MLNFKERVEANITSAHNIWLWITLNILQGILVDKVPDLKHEWLNLKLHNHFPLTRGKYWVTPDQTVHLKKPPQAEEDTILMSVEDKVSKGMGFSINPANKLGQTATSKVIRQVSALPTNRIYYIVLDLHASGIVRQKYQTFNHTEEWNMAILLQRQVSRHCLLLNSTFTELRFSDLCIQLRTWCQRVAKMFRD